MVIWQQKRFSPDDLALLGTLGSVLPVLETLHLHEPAAGPDGVQRLAEKLGAGALPAVTRLFIGGMHVGDAGASALAAALDRGALLRLEVLWLGYTAISDAALVAELCMPVGTRSMPVALLDEDGLTRGELQDLRVRVLHLAALLTHVHRA